MSSPPADSAAIRSRLLSRLGIHEAPPKSTIVASATSTGTPAVSVAPQPMSAAQHRRLRILRGMGVGYTFHHSPPDGSASRPPLNGVVPFSEPLKNHDLSPTTTPSPPSPPTVSSKHSASLSSSPSPKKHTKIAFQDNVEVIPIPTRYEYSDRIKSRIWSNRHELQENAERNALEFAAEGWNWRNVTEDEGMYICSASGELVHPIHLQHLAAHQHPQDDQCERKSLERGAPVH
jgi:hypothetical protein